MQSNILVEAIAHTAKTQPGSCALIARGQVLTYGQLWKASDALAAKLHRAATPNAPIVVFGHKDFHMVSSFIGCLKSGHAYIPVDVELPASRISDILSQLDTPFVIAAAPLSDALMPYVATDSILDISHFESPDSLIDQWGSATAPDKSEWVAGEQTQYIIFTSGSTGKPKGIEVSASNVANFARWVQTFPIIRNGAQTFLDQPPYSFDLSEYELVGALTTGGCLHSVSHNLVNNSRALFDDLATSNISVWVSTPSFADVCLADPSFNESLLPNTRLFLFCGEALSHTTAAALRERFPKAIVANTYGPTESTVAVTYCEIGQAEIDDDAPLPAGAARPGTEIRICDPETGARRATGETGEIVIVGDTVAKGYYRNPEKTNAAFFEAKLSDGSSARAYRTGDMGNLDERGILHCKGRLDSLVKLHGFRIELEDVEENIRALKGVDQACVVPVERQGRVSYLKAFVTLRKHRDGVPAYEELESRSFDYPSSGRIETPTKIELEKSLKKALGLRIPEYMVPRRCVICDSIPLTTNGKIDRKALASLSGKRS